MLITVSQSLFSKSVCPSPMAIKTLEAHARIYSENFKVKQDEYFVPLLGTINKAQYAEFDLVFNDKQ